MSQYSTHSPRFISHRRASIRKYAKLWKPAATIGTGGTAIAIWFDEIVMFGAEILALIFLPILAGVIYLLDILIFRSRIPRREDLKTHTNKGTKR